MKIVSAILAVTMLLLFAACGTADGAEDTTYSYRELDKMEEVTLEEDRIIFVIFENQAIPYRWKTSASGDALTLILDETVNGKGDSFSAGVSPAYHVFVYQWECDGEAKIELMHARYQSDDRNEANEIRIFFAYKQGDNISCDEVSDTAY